MSTIYKYPLTPGRTILALPSGAQALTVQMQRGEPFLWALVDTSKPPERRVFDVFATGHSVPDDARFVYVATFQMDDGALVWHVFETPHAA